MCDGEEVGRDIFAIRRTKIVLLEEFRFGVFLGSSISGDALARVAERTRVRVAVLLLQKSALIVWGFVFD